MIERLLLVRNVAAVRSGEMQAARGDPARLVFAATAALAAVHTVMDAFVALEPGTRWDDHVLAASVSLTLLVAAVVAWPQVRDGARAAMALVLGILALEGGALAVTGAISGGPRGEDWTGFLLGPAGIASCAVGARLLWRSRKVAGRRYVRRSVLVLAAGLGTYWLVVPIAVALMATHRPREVSEPIDLGRATAPVTVRTSDGLDIDGRYVASRNGAAVIVFPGSASRAGQARVLVDRGYGVLMLDMRGYADSDGDPNMFGWGASKDVDAAVAFLRARPDVRDGRIGGLGFSVGGEVMIEAGATNAGLRAVVADGAGERSLRESALRGPAGWFALPTYAVQTLAVAVLSGDPPPPSLVDLAPRIAPRPLFLIGAGRDNGGEDLQPHYVAAAREPKLYWKIPEAGHTGGFDARPREYARRLLAFFEESLLESA